MAKLDVSTPASSAIRTNVSAMVSSYWSWFTGMCLILIAIAYFRVLNGKEPVSFQTFLDYVANHFSTIRNFVSNHPVPTFNNIDSAPAIFKGAMNLWNNISSVFQVLYYLLSCVAKVIYTVFSILFWVLSGKII